MLLVSTDIRSIKNGLEIRVVLATLEQLLADPPLSRGDGRGAGGDHAAGQRGAAVGAPAGPRRLPRHYAAQEQAMNSSLIGH